MGGGLARTTLPDGRALAPGQAAKPAAPWLSCLQWVATGALPCVEAGSHHRPNHHANTARVIFR